MMSVKTSSPITVRNIQRITAGTSFRYGQFSIPNCIFDNIVSSDLIRMSFPPTSGRPSERFTKHRIRLVLGIEYVSFFSELFGIPNRKTILQIMFSFLCFELWSAFPSLATFPNALALLLHEHRIALVFRIPFPSSYSFRVG